MDSYNDVLRLFAFACVVLSYVGGFFSAASNRNSYSNLPLFMALVCFAINTIAAAWLSVTP